MGGANLDDTCGRKVKLDCPIYSKQTILKGVYLIGEKNPVKVTNFLVVTNIFPQPIILPD